MDIDNVKRFVYVMNANYLSYKNTRWAIFPLEYFALLISVLLIIVLVHKLAGAENLIAAIITIDSLALLYPIAIHIPKFKDWFDSFEKRPFAAGCYSAYLTMFFSCTFCSCFRVGHI